MVTKYYAQGETIRPVEFISETKRTVTTAAGLVYRKACSWCVYKDTFDEAKQYLLEESQRKIQQYEQLVQEEQARYMRIKNLQP